MVNKRKVAVLGATGMMGQKFVQLLVHHPWFGVSAFVLRQGWMSMKENEIVVTVGRVRRDSALNGLKDMALAHSLVRGGAGCSILNAELFLAKKLIK
jgi:aspartate-semialdehyde dehydrogenase